MPDLPASALRLPAAWICGLPLVLATSCADMQLSSSPGEAAAPTPTVIETIKGPVDIAVATGEAGAELLVAGVEGGCGGILSIGICWSQTSLYQHRGDMFDETTVRSHGRSITSPVPVPGLNAAGDIDGDGFPDLLSIRRSTVEIRYGNEEGFAETVELSTAGSRPISIVVSDMNGDGLDDLVVGDRGGMISLFLRVDARSFSAAVEVPHTGTGPIAAGDLNGDGFSDIASIPPHWSDGLREISVSLATSPAEFGGLTSFDGGRGELDIAVADIDGDSVAEIVVALAGESGADDAVPSPPSFSVIDGLDAAETTVAHYEADGLSDGIPAFEQVVRVGDAIGNDGIADVVLLDSRRGNDGKVLVFPGDGQGGFGEAILIGTMDAPATLVDAAIADTDGDGLNDLVVAYSDHDNGYAVIYPGSE